MEQFILNLLGPEGRLAALLPGYEFRPQQIDMAIEASRIFTESGIFLAEAGTGTGKSLAYLAAASDAKKPVIVSTGTKNLQEQLFSHDIPLLNRLITRRLSSILLKGRNNYLCIRRFNSFMESDVAISKRDKTLLEHLIIWSGKTHTGDRAELAEFPDDSWIWYEVCSKAELCSNNKCIHHADCFVIRQKIKAQHADIVVINHHLFFADALLKRNFNTTALPECGTLVFDEAHLLDEIAMQFLGVHIGSHEIDEIYLQLQQYRKLKKNLRKAAADPLNRSVLTAIEKSKIFFESFGKGEGRFSLSRRYGDDQKRMSTSMSFALADLRREIQQADKIPDEVLVELSNRLEDMTNRLAFINSRNEPGFVYWGEYQSRGNVLHANPLDISKDFVEIILDQSAPVLLTSATLTAMGSFDYIRRLLGVRDAQEKIYDSPFDFRHQGILYLPQHLPDPQQQDFLPKACKEILDILWVTQGRAFVLSTSYKAMYEIAAYLDGKLPYKIFVQGEAPRHHLIELFKNDRNSVLVATSSFWQGIDVPGDALSCVIIDKLPFAAPTDPITEGRIQIMQETGRDPFNEYQIPEAIIALKQGVGRLIRSRSDRGVVVILDRRIKTRSYGKKFLQSLPAFSICYNLSDVALFFSNEAI